MDIITRIITK